jgi:hypothetical protein
MPSSTHEDGLGATEVNVRGEAQVRTRLASAWRQRGRLDLARAGLEQALHLDPGFVEAHIQLGSLALQAGSLDEALQHFCQAAALSPQDGALRTRVQYLQELKIGASRVGLSHGQDFATIDLMDQPNGKLNLRGQKTFDCHRSGWNLVLDALRPLHNSRGVLFDGFIENNFAWRHWNDEIRPLHVLLQLKQDGLFDELATSAERGVTPYREPWVGILHNPPNMPKWFHYREAPQSIFAKSIWRESLPTCLGFFTFSRYHAEWLADVTQKPVSPLIFPTEIPDRLFDFDLFCANPAKKIVQIGWWLRRIQAIHELPVALDNTLGYEKIRLSPRFFAGADGYLLQLMAIERRETEPLTAPPEFDNTRVVQHLANDAYDALLTENIAFVYLYDANANNAVVECIARGTPLLINRLPAVQEYLGAHYPFYYDDLHDAAQKCQDMGRVRAAHEYLMRCETRPKLDGDYFRCSFERSDVYQSLPKPMD